MARMTVDETTCKGCGLCIAACPKKIIELAQDKINSKGFNVAYVIDMEKCIGCAFCAMMCPDVAIKVEK